MTPNQYRCEPIELKCWSISFQAMKSGKKRFEYRKDDRPYDIGVPLWQREWNPGTGYTGDELYHDVTFIIRGGVFGIPVGYCIISVSEPRICVSYNNSQSEREKILDRLDKEIAIKENEMNRKSGLENNYTAISGYYAAAGALNWVRVVLIDGLRSKGGEQG